MLGLLGLRPASVLEECWVWQPVTYMFLHAGLFHILFNMLALWMFGVELERLWGRTFFLKYYFVTGIGAAVTTLLLSLVPIGFGELLWNTVTVGASGAVYGLLLAYALYFPDRPIYIMALFPVPAKSFVLIMGAIALMFVGRRRPGRRRQHRAPRRPGLRLPLSEGLAYAPAGRGQVPVRQVEDEPSAQEVRRPHGRAQRLGPARALTLRTTNFDELSPAVSPVDAGVPRRPVFPSGAEHVEFERIVERLGLVRHPGRHVQHLPSRTVNSPRRRRARKAPCRT